MTEKQKGYLVGMFAKSSLEERCRMILEKKGGKIAEEARTVLLKERSLSRLRHPLKHVSVHWRDPATPSLIILSCEAVGGKADRTIHQAAEAMTLMNLSINLWDDLVDKTMYKGFVPTVLGKFGEGVTLIIGGLASAKAFSILNEMELDEVKRRYITELIWNYLEKTAVTEATDLELRRRGDIRPEEKLKVIEMQAIGLEASCKIGAVLGNGSKDEIRHLGRYGRYLSVVLDLRKDFIVSINLTLELAEKIRSGSLPYTLSWAKNRSRKIADHLPLLAETIKPIDIKEIVEAMLETKVMENTKRLLRRFTKNAQVELLPLGTNNATRTLKFFLEAQYKIFLERLSAYGSE